ncbi:MAG: hypothetical protein M3680_21790 [Myxococcota bacterium]|nr:hypothetical protein [Myxococcota bacterium]
MPTTLLPELAHLRAGPDGEAEILAGSRGEVTSCNAFDWKKVAPEPGGTACERIFGTLFRCGCGAEDAMTVIRRDATARATCEACGEPAPRSERAERFGHIALPFPVAHPLFGDASPLTAVPVLPPGLRVIGATAAIPKPPHPVLRYTALVTAIGRLARMRAIGAKPEILERSSSRITRDVGELMFHLLLGWGPGGVGAYLRTLDDAVGRGEVSLLAPGAHVPSILRLRGLGLGLVSRAPHPAPRIDAFTVTLPAARAPAELLPTIAAIPDPLHRLRTRVEARALVVETLGLVVHAAVTGAEIRIAFTLDERYRGELWEASSGAGRVYYRTPVEVNYVVRALEAIAGASIVDVRYARMFRG